jgi:hypothetical protein
LPQNQLDALLDAQLEDPVRYRVLLALAAGIATYGLIGDSSPVIIGAMIVSPLMSPILGLAYDDVLPLVPLLCVTGIGLAGLMDVVNHGNFLLNDLSWPVTSGSFLLFFQPVWYHGGGCFGAAALRLWPPNGHGPAVRLPQPAVGGGGDSALGERCIGVSAGPGAEVIACG